MPRVLVEGTVKEAWGRRFKISIANHRRGRVPSTKTLSISGFRPQYMHFYVFNLFQ